MTQVVPPPVVSDDVCTVNNLLALGGTADTGMVASATTIACSELAGWEDDFFNDKYYMQVILNANAVGVAPEPEYRLITDYVSLTGTFTVNLFSADVQAGDELMVIHESIYDTFVRVDQIFDLANAILTLQETGGDLTATGGEDVVYLENSPLGVHKPLRVFIDLDNMLAGDTIEIREYYRIASGAGLDVYDYSSYSGIDGGLTNGRKGIIIECSPNRFGWQITLEQTAGVNRVYPWEVLEEA